MRPVSLHEKLQGMVKEATMAKRDRITTELAPVDNNLTVLPPNSGVVGKFLEETQNMLRARAMRMNGLLKRINESGQRTEGILRMAAETYGGRRSKPDNTVQD